MVMCVPDPGPWLCGRGSVWAEDPLCLLIGLQEHELRQLQPYHTGHKVSGSLVEVRMCRRTVCDRVTICADKVRA